jgi:hypothetical protein
MLNKRVGIRSKFNRIHKLYKLIAHCETELAVYYKQAFYARGTATADGLPCLKVNYIRPHYNKSRIF